MSAGSPTPEFFVSLWIKICGVTSVEDAKVVQEAGADAVGLNFARQSSRYLEPQAARPVADAVRGKLELVGVFVDAEIDEVLAIARRVGLDAVQLHGDESPAFLDALSGQIKAYKALRIGSPDDAKLARQYGSRRILADAKVQGAMGGTGHTFDWSLIEDLNSERDLIIAGGLRPSNVADCVSAVAPYGIDTASGVEDAPGRKNADKVSEFVSLARRAASGSPH